MTKKRDVKFIVFGVISLFLIAGCAGGVDTGSASTTPFVGGTRGLEMGFLTGSPPDEVTDGGTFPFQVMVSLKNSGEYDLKKELVKISLIGFLPSDFGVSDISLLSDRMPDDDLTPVIKDSGGAVLEPIETFVTFPSTGGNFEFIPTVSGSTTFIFRADVCYRYVTNVVSEICVLEDIINPPSNAICNPAGSQSIFSSGSPIEVSSFKQSVVGRDRIQFSFDIIHNGKGDVFEDNTVTISQWRASDNCPKAILDKRLKEDQVKVIVGTGLPGLKCVGLTTSGTTSEGLVRLVDGRRRTITCTQDLDTTRTDFKKNIQIGLQFNYQDNVDKNVLIRQLID